MGTRRVRGDRAFGRLLKQLPETVTSELRAQLKRTGGVVLAAEQRRAPMRSGALQSALSYKVAPKRLSLKVGLVGKAINRKLFYGWFIEGGRKGGGRGVKRGSAKYSAGVGMMPARHIVYVPGLREQIYPAFREIWVRALKKAAAGARDD